MGVKKNLGWPSAEVAIPWRLRKLLVFGLSVEAITILHNNHADVLNKFFIEHIQGVEEFDYEDVAIAFWDAHPAVVLDIIALGCGRYDKRGIKKVSRLPIIGKLRALFFIGQLTFHGYLKVNIDETPPKTKMDEIQQKPIGLDDMVAEWKAHASLLLSENYTDAFQYPIGRLIDEAFVVNTRKNKELASNLMLFHSAMADVASMAMGGKKTAAFGKMIKQLSGENNGKAK